MISNTLFLCEDVRNTEDNELNVRDYKVQVNITYKLTMFTWHVTSLEYGVILVTLVHYKIYPFINAVQQSVIIEYTKM